MFEIGDKIVYPMHGAGIIEAIEEKEILGDKQLYYVATIKNMRVMFPVGADTGIRQIVDSDKLENALAVFNDEAEEPIPNATQRYRNNLNKMKTGDILEGAEVIRNLVHLSRKRALAPGDKAMLENARQIFISELTLVKGIEQEEATELLDEVING